MWDMRGFSFVIRKLVEMEICEKNFFLKVKRSTFLILSLLKLNSEVRITEFSKIKAVSRLFLPSGSGGKTFNSSTPCKVVYR